MKMHKGLRASVVCLHLHLQFQDWVASHVNQQAVEGGQALRVTFNAGTKKKATHLPFIKQFREINRWIANSNVL